MPKPILCLDFDGVCHSYTSGWKGATTIPDPPVEGMWPFIIAAARRFEIHVYSSRSHQEGGISAMIDWFADHLVTYPGQWYFFKRYSDRMVIFRAETPLWLQFPKKKPSAMVTLDDRALTFTGVWPDVDALREFKPWNKA